MHKEIEIFFQSKSNVSKLSDHYNLELAPGGHSAQRLNAAGMWAQEEEREKEREHVRTKGGKERERESMCAQGERERFSFNTFGPLQSGDGSWWTPISTAHWGWHVRVSGGEIKRERVFACKRERDFLLV